MAENLYTEILELPQEHEDPNLYQLLLVDVFESNGKSIHKAGLRQIRKLKDWELHPDPEVSTQVQDLLPTLIDLCSLDTVDKPTAFNGTSLAGLLKDSANELPDRKLVIQYKASGAPWDPAVVLWNKWRLVGGEREECVREAFPVAGLEQPAALALDDELRDAGQPRRDDGQGVGEGLHQGHG